MEEMYWLDSHIGTIDQAKELAEEFTWILTISQHDGIWYVLDGDSKIFSSSQRKHIDIFLYGLGLAYAVIPEPYNEKLRTDLNSWIENL